MEKMEKMKFLEISGNFVYGDTSQLETKSLSERACRQVGTFSFNETRFA